MRKTLLRRPSPAMVVACAALGVALGGTSYATVLALPKSSVGTAQLKNGAVTTPKLKNDAVTARKISFGAVQSGEIADGAVTTAEIRDAAVTTGKLAPNAVTTTQVADGTLLKTDFKTGELAGGFSGLERRDVPTSSSSTSPKSVVVTCPAGKRVVGGGARVIGSGAGVVSIIESFPDSDGDKWNAKASEVVATSLTWQLQAYALCATVAA